MKKYVCNGHEIYPTVEIVHDIVPEIAGITLGEFFASPRACASAWKKANTVLYDYFGDSIPMRKPSPPPLSYAHLACLGAEIEYSETGEPNVHPAVSSIDDGIALLKERRFTDFSREPIIRKYDEFIKALTEEFPDGNIVYSAAGYQGPVTSAVLLRGQDFYMDLYDEPEKCREFLSLITDSIISYFRFNMVKHGHVPSDYYSAALCDDFSALIAPEMWDEFVIPYFEKYYSGILPGCTRRFLHCEGLTPRHLPYLKPLGLRTYQPSVSDNITLDAAAKYRGECYMFFDYLLYSYKVVGMTDGEISEWVDKVLSYDVEKPRTQLGAYAYREGKLDRIKAYMRAFDKYIVQ